MTVPASDFGEALDRYLTALRAVGSAFPDQVRPDPNNGPLLEALRNQGMTVPGEVVDWFGWFGFLEAPVVPSNGWSEFAPALDCLPLSKAVELNERWRREMVMDGIAPYWFPIAQFWHSASIVVNCTPEYGTGIQAKTAYLSELAELRSESQWLPNLSTLLRWWAERVETGGWTYDAQVGWREHVAPTSDSERFATGLI